MVCPLCTPTAPCQSCKRRGSELLEQRRRERPDHLLDIARAIGNLKNALRAISPNVDLSEIRLSENPYGLYDFITAMRASPAFVDRHADPQQICGVTVTARQR